MQVEEDNFIDFDTAIVGEDVVVTDYTGPLAAFFDFTADIRGSNFMHFSGSYNPQTEDLYYG